MLYCLCINCTNEKDYVGMFRYCEINYIEFYEILNELETGNVLLKALPPEQLRTAKGTNAYSLLGFVMKTVLSPWEPQANSLLKNFGFISLK